MFLEEGFQSSTRDLALSDSARMALRADAIGRIELRVIAAALDGRHTVKSVGLASSCQLLGAGTGDDGIAKKTRTYIRDNIFSLSVSREGGSGYRVGSLSMEEATGDSDPRVSR